MSDSALSYSNLFVDTGSAVTFFNPYVPTPTAVKTPVVFNETFGSGETASGNVFRDTISLGGTGIKLKMDFGGVTYPSNPYGPGPESTNGYVGFAPQELADAVFGSGGAKPGEVKTLMTQLTADKLIDANIIGLGFVPADLQGLDGLNKGALTLGGIDKSVLKSEMTWTSRLPPIFTAVGFSAQYWSFAMEIPSLGIYKKDATASYSFIDTGATITLLQPKYFKRWFSKIEGATLSPAEQLVKVPRSSIHTIPDLDIVIEGVPFTIPGKYLLFPDSYLRRYGYDMSTAWSYVAATPQPAQFNVLGAYSLARLYVALDAQTSPPRIGFGKTTHTPHLTRLRRKDSKMLIALQIIIAAAYVADASVLKLRVHHRHRLQSHGGAFVPTKSFMASSFYTNLTIGTTHPVTYENVMLDSGSGPIYVNPYTPDRSAVASKVVLAEAFSDGTAVEAIMYRDQVAVGDLAFNLGFGGIKGSKNAKPDPTSQGGIIGLGPQGLVDDALLDGGGKPGQFLGFAAQLKASGIVKRNIIGLGFTVDDLNDALPADRHGLYIGGIDHSKLRSDIVYSPRLPAYINIHGRPREFWAVAMTIPSIGLTADKKADVYTIIDTGSTLTYLKDPYFSKWAEPIKGLAQTDYGFLSMPKSSVPLIPDLDFFISGRKFSMPGSSLVLSDEVAKTQGLDTKLAWTNIQPSLATQAGNVFGALSLTSFYVVLDADAKRIGFARTAASPL
ncbi:uncharacterized protein L969DRAFT_93045 [Mixia osmundae IAM 14324]|uniref:Peptidase A1 domain-containing protein n=1 Tax=Mixia osmundae (strain CBS 9802 / IAM 14324 / JCM 22182 / KY 12970) TaxID=764103 RepID=G7E697_MIXOS|nr:uncharacterized protein L969DRAFT_93045 [Mixia osmundae IAM 14324]KEI40487.1 hypothetical protein L969DRAFT_93045 [Mixia osmundae IAM 14324]GAA98357.1 hypothetical protein E5Q_05043 [Mixia osmundae IAM 14324]